MPGPSTSPGAHCRSPPQQQNWLDARGLTCDGTRGDAADLIGDRVNWRHLPLTDPQLLWYRAREQRAPHFRGLAADEMAKTRKKEAKVMSIGTAIFLSVTMLTLGGVASMLIYVCGCMHIEKSRERQENDY